MFWSYFANGNRACRMIDGSTVLIVTKNWSVGNEYSWSAHYEVFLDGDWRVEGNVKTNRDIYELIGTDLERSGWMRLEELERPIWKY